MEKEVDIKAVIGFSGNLPFTQVMSMMGYYFILTTSILYILLGPLLLLDIYFLELKLFWEVMTAKFQVILILTQPLKYQEMENISLVLRQVSQASLLMSSFGIFKPEKLNIDSSSTKHPLPVWQFPMTPSF